MSLNINIKGDISDSIAETSNTLLKPVSSVTQTLTDIWNIVLGDRLSYYREKQLLKYSSSLEQFKDEIEYKINKIPVEELIEPDFQNIANTLENARYCLSTDELRSMFSSLVANSTDINKAGYIHPSFSYALKQMNGNDARMLNYLIYNKRYPMVDYIYQMDNSFKTDQINIFLKPRCTLLESMDAISSLNRLGLLQIDKGYKIADASVYKQFENEDYYVQMGERKALIKYSFSPSGYGMAFKSACQTSR